MLWPVPHVLVAGLVCLVGPAWGAAFDCHRAASRVERVICATAELSALDDELADLFSAQRSQVADRDALRDAQRAWLRRREACADLACLRRLYQDRAADLACLDTAAMGAAIGVASCARAQLRVLDRRLDERAGADPGALASWRSQRQRSCHEQGQRDGGAPGWQSASALQCEVEASRARLATPPGSP